MLAGRPPTRPDYTLALYVNNVAIFLEDTKLYIVLQVAKVVQSEENVIVVGLVVVVSVVIVLHVVDIVVMEEP